MHPSATPASSDAIHARPRAADYISARLGFKVPAERLAKLAQRGGGPVFHKWGHRAVYLQADLDAWIEARLGPARRSTSDVVTHGEAHATH